jgi:uncharacterized protein
MITTLRIHLVFLLALAFAAPALAGTDPTLHQVYEAARTGQLGQAQEMMNQVLRDHPKSAKAHYVAAELYAREGHSSLARQELHVAQELAPGLPFAKPESVRALQTGLTQGQAMREIPGYSPASESFHTSFPWGAVLLLLTGIGVLGMIFRRKNSPSAVVPQYPGGVPTAAGPTGNSVGTAVAPSVGAGIGSGIAGGLASGLAVGAGVVAGEELARHFLGPDQHVSNAPSIANAPVDYPLVDAPDNSDMGGSDFGVSADDSWDDGGSVGGDVNGDDWT